MSEHQLISIQANEKQWQRVDFFFRSDQSKMYKINLKMMAQIPRRLQEKIVGPLVRMLLLNLARVRG